MMTGVRLLTPSLLLADQPPPSLPHAVPVDAPERALRVIEAGGVAVLPGDAVPAAAAVLAALGLAPNEVEERIRFAFAGDPGRDPLSEG